MGFTCNNPDNEKRHWGVNNAGSRREDLIRVYGVPLMELVVKVCGMFHVKQFYECIMDRDEGGRHEYR